MDEKIYCSQCGKECASDGVGTGYGETSEGTKVCYECCGKNDLEQLKALKVGEKMVLYIRKDKDYGYSVTNWPGTMSVKCDYANVSYSGGGSMRMDVGFRLDGRSYYGVHYASAGELVTVKARKG